MTGDVVISLQPGSTISGQVVDMAGVPVPGASIYCERPQAAFSKRSVGTRATSDTQGRFEVTDLPPEACTIYAHHKGYSRASVEGVLGARTDLVLRMQPAPMVAGRAVDGPTGEPIAEFKVQIAADYRVQTLHMDPLLFQDCDGYWQAQHWQMKAGAELFVEVSANGYSPTRIRGSARVDPPRDQNVVRLFPGTTVVGVLRDEATGTPIVGPDGQSSVVTSSVSPIISTDTHPDYTNLGANFPGQFLYQFRVCNTTSSSPKRWLNCSPACVPSSC